LQLRTIGFNLYLTGDLPQGGGIVSKTLLRMWFVLFGAGLVSSQTSVAADKPDPHVVARQVDMAIGRALGAGVTLPSPADDAAFLRRVSIDLTGVLPTPADLEAFLADNSRDKRQRLVEKLLASDACAVNWGRYWRDVLTYHMPASGNYLRWEFFDTWMVDQIRANRPFGDIVTEMLTATGVNDETPAVNFLTAHFGNPIEVAATTSRVFLGVQLQCAQCHDAKTESWKREQFHELVAFFGRAKIIQHKDVTGRGTPYAIEGRADGQYTMSDLKNPSRHIPMTPRFLTGEAISSDAPDLERRQALARMVTSPKNPWFARTYVNRMWTAFLGWGFYPGLADLGSEIEPRYPEALNILAKGWTASGYDMRWLWQTIIATQAYQRQMQPRFDSESARPAAVCPQRLRPEQIFEAMVRSLGFDEKDRSIPAPAPSSAPAVTRHTGLRHMVYQAFREDPSLPPAEIQGTIPQALLMMNSVLVNTYVAANGKTYLAGALKQKLPDDKIVVALYERTLARLPQPRELETCLSYIRRVGRRAEALEDIFWALINSTEFLTKK
jgi:hypothetical protein